MTLRSQLLQHVFLWLCIAGLILTYWVWGKPDSLTLPPGANIPDWLKSSDLPELRPIPPAHIAPLIDSIYRQRKLTLNYNASYVPIDYPRGDVPMDYGVCTDVIIRGLREHGIDLQQAIHEDMSRAFKDYPKKWGLRRPDPNIDHRRVPNMMRYFERQEFTVNSDQMPEDFLPGDIVAWQLNDKQDHIGFVMVAKSRDGQRPLIGHNIDDGVKIQDVLYTWPIIGHYRLLEAPSQKTLTTDHQP